MQTAIPTLHSIGTGVGDVLPIIRPLHFIAPAIHLPDEMFLTAADFHRLGHIVHQTELPTLALGRDAVLPVAHALAAFLIGRQYGKTMGKTKLVTDGTELFECTGVLPQFVTIYEADRVDNKMGVDMLGITVGGDLDFVTRPCFHSELSGNLVSLSVGNVFSGREGLDILVEVDAVQLAVGCLGGFKLQNGIQSVTVDAADQSALRLFIPSLVLPHTVIHHGSHSTEVLLCLADISHGSDMASPPRLIR